MFYDFRKLKKIKKKQATGSACGQHALVTVGSIPYLQLILGSACGHHALAKFVFINST